MGEPLRDFRGVLTGVPIYEGNGQPDKQTEKSSSMTDAAQGNAKDGCWCSRRRGKDAALTKTMLADAGISCEVCLDIQSSARSSSGAAACWCPKNPSPSAA